MNRATAIIGAVSLLLAAVTASWLLRERLAPALPVLDTLGGDFRLHDTSGREVTLADYSGRVVLLNFGFTTCPDVCPTVLARMRQVLKELGPEAATVVPLFVTIDPVRDTPERLAPYLAHFSPAFVGLTGGEAEVRAAAAPFKAYYERIPLPAPMAYGFAHSDQIYLLDRAGRVRATFGNAVRVPEMAATVRRLLVEPHRSGGEPP